MLECSCLLSCACASTDRLYEYAAAFEHPIELDPEKLKKTHIAFNRARASELGLVDPKDYDLCIPVPHAYESVYAPAQVHDRGSLQHPCCSHTHSYIHATPQVHTCM